jgi:HNH endonuclease
VGSKLTKGLTAALSEDLPVLFAYIGWNTTYDGTSNLEGTHRYLKTHRRDTSDARAFDAGRDVYQSGIGHGQTPSPLHIAFIALHPVTLVKEVVGLYAGASVDMKGDWAIAKTRNALLIPVEKRPRLSTKWLGQGMRRWAAREGGRVYQSLLKEFEDLKSDLPILAGDDFVLDQNYASLEPEAIEGAKRKRMITERLREWRLRAAKIADVMAKCRGRLACEVPGCGFDFVERYGEKLGKGYAHVHHLTPLSKAGSSGRSTTFSGLAIVCANCHAMIHKGGNCRELGSLIPKTRAFRRPRPLDWN